MISPAWDPDELARPPAEEEEGRRRPGTPRMARRTRRQLLVVLIAALCGFSVPVWVPRLLSTLPVFRFVEVRVAGTQIVRPDEVRRFAGVDPEASVWDDPQPWEARAREHPLIREATARRLDSRVLEITVVEERPVALVATPELRPVGGNGWLLPLDLSSEWLDLPILSGLAETEEGFVADADTRELTALLDRLHRTRRDFISLVSEVGAADRGGYRFLLLPGAGAEVVLLPREGALRALDRVSIALGQVEEGRVARADARFGDQVVLTRAEAAK